MSPQDDPENDPHQIEFIDVPDTIGHDAIDSHTRGVDWWRMRRTQYLFTAVLLVVAVIVAYQLGSRAKKAAPSPVVSSPQPVASTPIDRSPALAETGLQCAAQVGKQLQVGIQIINQSVRPLTLMTLTPTMPGGGLRATSQARGTCGQLTLTAPIAGTVLAPGATIWSTMTLDVLVSCPGAYPVQFSFVIAQGRTGSTVKLGGFNDLGGVTYSGCPTAS
jgi:hypothetical protein